VSSLKFPNASLFINWQFGTQLRTEAESKEKHGVWDPIPELTLTSSYVHSRVDSNTFTVGNPMPESTLTLCHSRLYPPVRDFGFGPPPHHMYHVYRSDSTEKTNRKTKGNGWMRVRTEQEKKGADRSLAGNVEQKPWRN
jgi:hypothetical protein